MKRPTALSFFAIVVGLVLSNFGKAEDFNLSLRYRIETNEGSGRYHTLTRSENWPAGKTAVIVCDVWDSHHSHGAVERVLEMAPRLEAFLQKARRQGAVIIHAPSDCMKAYDDHPARLRAMSVPKAPSYPPEITRWCYKIPKEEKGTYPIDQSEGGCDDDPLEHAAWVKELKAQGRNVDHPWLKQLELITIDPQQDYITSLGDEVWNILADRGIENVMLTGVHTNMCVLGRPFGLRQMAKNGKSVVLVRDLTDTMYNPARAPFVSHFTGTDLIVEHIEKFVCPTITSDQLLGGKPFRFSADTRPTIAILTAEDEYKTEETLPPYALKHLGKEFRTRLIFGSETGRSDIPGIEAIATADVLLVSVRRRPLPPQQLKVVREFVAAGKPMVGIRTASHAFCLRNKPPEEGLADWPEFDNQVWGGNYSNHYGNDLAATITPVAAELAHPILQDVPLDEFQAGGSLYRPSPLAEETRLLMTGRVEGHDPEPVAWIFTRADGGRSFYTSLGHVKDFENPAFTTMLTNALRWAAKGE